MEKLTLFAASVAVCISASLFSGSLAGQPLTDVSAAKVFQGGAGPYDCFSAPCMTPNPDCVMIGTTNVFRKTEGTNNAMRTCIYPCPAMDPMDGMFYGYPDECTLFDIQTCYKYYTCIANCNDMSCGEPSITEEPTDCMTGGTLINCFPPMS